MYFKCYFFETTDNTANQNYCIYCMTVDSDNAQYKSSTDYVSLVTFLFHSKRNKNFTT